MDAQQFISTLSRRGLIAKLDGSSARVLMHMVAQSTQRSWQVKYEAIGLELGISRTTVSRAVARINALGIDPIRLRIEEAA